MAAVAAGEYPTVAEAQQVMASPVCKQYLPDASKVGIYDELYQNYQTLGDYVSGGKA